MCVRAHVLMCIRDVCAHVLIVTLFHCVFIEVCDVENVNFSQQADEAAIRNLYMHVYTLCVRVCAFVCVWYTIRLPDYSPSFPHISMIYS